ncbi:GNAT family N-acetyltransferase [Bdellovibrio sp. HCB337]|uniref:GNAT family N-acetyltransferase n=1 Tax=Bdellovibrio sp. HCB337 TaxID=3394358 RepID=UPI0039A59588
MNKHQDLKIVVDTSAANFLTECGPLLYRDEPTNSLLLGLLEGAAAAPATSQPPLLIRVIENGVTVTVAASLRRAPMNIILTYAEDAHLQLIAEHLKATGEVFTGVVGPRRESESFANIWKKMSGQSYELEMAQMIYKITDVTFPKGVSGELKVADNFDLFLKWMHAFTKECLPGDRRTDQQWKEFAEGLMSKQRAFFWYVDNKPVGMAIYSRPTKHGVSVSGVYTPPENRRKGYASAIVAGLSQRKLDEGRQFCVLYTDLSNPTSNKIYKEVGYREVCESRHFNFNEV